MAYTLDTALVLGPAKTGLSDLRAQLVDTSGANVGSAVSTGFVEIGTSGNYLWHYTAFPDAHRGGVKFYSDAAPSTILAFVAINPEEAERVDVAISTRSTVTTAQVNAEVDAALADYDPPTKAELDSAVATLATAANLATVAGYLDTEIAAILAAIDTEVATLVTNVAAILADTGTDGVALSTAVQNAIADAVLSRSVSNTEGSASIYTLTGIILAAFESAVSGGTWTINRTDGVTTFATRTVATDANAEPITGVS